MKKLLCLLLAATLGLGTCACGKTEEGGKTDEAAGQSDAFAFGKLYAGYGRADISPDNPTPLGGYGQAQNRMHNAVIDPLYATCIAFTDGDETFLLFTVDAVRSKGEWTDAVRQQVDAQYGIPAENVQIVSTHTHGAPETTSTMAVITGEYTKIYTEGLLEAAKQAMADRSEVKMYQGAVQTENLTFVRHVLMNDGTVAGPNFGNWSSGVKEYMVEGDREMLLVKLDRVDESKKDILMMNFQSHPVFTGGSDKTEVSADYVGACRRVLEEQTGMHFAFFLGACGNQTPTSYFPKDNNTMPYADKLSGSDRTYITYGEALAQYALDLLPTLTELPGAGIKTTSRTVTVNTNKNQDASRIADAQAVVNEWETKNRDEGNKLARQLGFDSVYEASGLLGQSNLPNTNDIKLFATRIGGLNFVNAPYEMFSTNSLYIKDNAPGAFTMVFTQSNQAWGYITDEKAHEYKCYENFGGNFAPGSGELLAENMVEMLGEVQ